MEITRAQLNDVPETAHMLTDAFAQDPNMEFLFGGTPSDRRSLVAEFFDILMTARIELAMPVFVLHHQDRIGGIVMGYDLSRPDWPVRQSDRWRALQMRCSGADERFATHDAIVERFTPNVPQYYLGVLGVHPSLQGKGAGRMLVEHFCGVSDQDPESAGVSIETANPRNASYYESLGFKRRGDAELDAATRLYVLFRPRPLS
jgi:ribosomal protein S18 acetylase RimI-like enzyme